MPAPSSWQTRLVPVDVAGLRLLRIFVPERHDLALMGASRGTTHDLQGIEDVHVADPLRLGVLIARHYEMDEGPDHSELARLGLLALVERLYGAETAARTEVGLRTQAGGTAG